MPNWCDNEVSIFGDAEQMKELVTLVKELAKKSENRDATDNTRIHFMEELIGIDDKPDNYEEGGWYEYNIERFGTKWDFDIADCYGFHISDTQIFFGIGTAWLPIDKFLDKLCKKYGVKASVIYAEPGCGFAGITTFDENGQVEDICYDDYLEGLYNIDSDRFFEEVESWLDGSEHLNGTLDAFVDKYCPFIKDDMKAMSIVEEKFDEFKNYYDEKLGDS